MATEAHSTRKTSPRLTARRFVRTATLAPGLALLLSVTACDLFDSSPTSAPPPRPAPAPSMAVTQVTPTDAAAEYQRPEYPGRRRNPFQPDVDVLQPVSTAVVGEVRPLDPLEEFALSSLALSAIISEAAVPLAMFVDSTGFGHFVKEGDRIGRNGGIISMIRDNEVEVREGNQDDPNFAGNVITIKLRDLEIVADDGLTDTEREALDRLMRSERGREVLERIAREISQPAAAPEPARAAQADPRFQGTLPPR
jgi:Tfp pilus assembly protein PilP